MKFCACSLRFSKSIRWAAISAALLSALTLFTSAGRPSEALEDAEEIVFKAFCEQSSKVTSPKMVNVKIDVGQAGGSPILAVDLAWQWENDGKPEIFSQEYTVPIKANTKLPIPGPPIRVEKQCVPMDEKTVKAALKVSSEESGLVLFLNSLKGQALAQDKKDGSLDADLNEGIAFFGHGSNSPFEMGLKIDVESGGGKTSHSMLDFSAR